MIPVLRSLTDRGVDEFRRYLGELRTGDAASLPTELLHDDALTKRMGNEPIPQIRVSSKLELATYISQKIATLMSPDLLHDQGLWTWLAVLFFDQLCPRGTGERVGQDYRYILEKDYRHRHRHLVAGPVRLYLTHGPDTARLLLAQPVHVLGDVTEQLASRQYIASNRGLMQAAALLYWDEERKLPKIGAAATDRRPGTLRRFVDVAEQFDMTYDTYVMTGDQVVSLLPREFTAWLPTR